MALCVLCSFLAQFAMSIEDSKQLHSRSAGEIIYTYRDILVFTFYRGISGANVRYSKAAANTTAAPRSFVPIEIFRAIVKSKDSFKA